MKVTGIIAEYNPFHNGHAYQLAKARQLTGADYLIIAMSGDFIQRGGPAITDKHTRAEMALHAGADLVLELSVPCATGSAEYFADGGVRLLAATSVVDYICYGMEDQAPAFLPDAAALLAAPPAAFDTQISQSVRDGCSYPAAREEALVQALPRVSSGELRSFLAKPNNILALEYEKAILRHNQRCAQAITGLGVRRAGDGYHDTDAHSAYASATAIRRMLTEETPVSSLARMLPEHSLKLLEKAVRDRLLLTDDDFSEALYMRLLACRGSGYDSFADCSEAISNRIRDHLNDYLSFSQFADLIKTRDVTRTRINRILTHILLDIRKEDYDPRPACLRVLGFTRRAEPLLSEIHKKASAPLVTRVADALHTLPKPAAERLAADIRAAELYRGISRIKSALPLRGEYNTSIIIP